MNTYSINEITTSVDRYKLFALFCDPSQLVANVTFLQDQNITAVNIGKEVAIYISSLRDRSYIAIDVYDFIKKVFDQNKTKISSRGNSVIAIYNLGILLEPYLELNTVQLLKEFSKTAALIIIWENQSDVENLLHWLTQKQHYFLDFSETHLKKLEYAV